MIRVDHRLIHGQVAVSWLRTLGSDAILVANDAIPGDELRKSTLKMARPAEVKLVIKTIDDSAEAINTGRTDKYKLFIVVESVADAYRLATQCSSITHINLGGTRKADGTKNVYKTVNLTLADMEQLEELASRGIEVEARAVPAEKPIVLTELRRKW